MYFMESFISTSEINFNIYNLTDDDKTYLLSDKVVIPRSFENGRQLSHIRMIIDTVIKQYNIECATLECEEIDDIGVVEVLKIEGVMEELLSSSGVRICK